MTQLGKSKARYTAERELEEKRKKRKLLDEEKALPKDKAQATKEITALRKKACIAGSIHVGNKLALGFGKSMRERMDTDKDSAKYIFEDALGHEGAMAMAAELREAIKKVRDIYNIVPAGGSTNYIWIQFKHDLDCKKEEPVSVVKLPDPANGPVSVDKNPFPTAGIYNKRNKRFTPLPLYTKWLQHVVYRIATSVPNKHLLFLRCNYLYTVEGMPTEKFSDGVHHSDFVGSRSNESYWREFGHPVTNILCVSGKTPLGFSSVRKHPKIDHAVPKKLRAETRHVLSAGDAVLLGWRQYHATKLTDDAVTGPNCRVQAMLSCKAEDLEGADATVSVHMEKKNWARYEEMIK
jgi:hypothetical protein